MLPFILAAIGLMGIGVGALLVQVYNKKAAALFGKGSEMALRINLITPLQSMRRQFPTNDPRAFMLLIKGRQLYLIVAGIGLLLALVGFGISIYDLVSAMEYANSLQ